MEQRAMYHGTTINSVAIKSDTGNKSHTPEQPSSRVGVPSVPFNSFRSWQLYKETRRRGGVSLIQPR